MILIFELILLSSLARSPVYEVEEMELEYDEADLENGDIELEDLLAPNVSDEQESH